MTMKVQIELESEEAIDLVAILSVLIDCGVMHMGEFPLQFSSISKIFNSIHQQTLKKIPIEEFFRLAKKHKEERL
jgi:hypothetical protein